MGLIRSIGSFFKNLFVVEKQVIRYPIDEELIRKDKLIKAQQQQLSGRDAQLAKIKATQREKLEADKSKDYQQELAKKLREQEIEIRQKRFRFTFSLRYLFNKMGFSKRQTAFGRDIDLTDKDDKVIFGKFKDILIADNGYFIITDQDDNIIHYAKDMTQLVWKPDGLSNYMKRKRLPIALDENMNPVPDLEEEEHPDVIFDEQDGVYKETLARQRPVKEMLIERDEKIRELHRKLERHEKMVIEKDHRIQELSRTVRLIENRSNLSQAEISGILEKSMQFENRAGDMHTQIVKLTEFKAMMEMLNERKDIMIKSLLEKLEKAGVDTIYDIAKADVQNLMEWAKKNIGDTTIMPSETPIERPVIQSNQPMGRLTR